MAKCCSGQRKKNNIGVCLSRMGKLLYNLNQWKFLSSSQQYPWIYVHLQERHHQPVKRGISSRLGSDWCNSGWNLNYNWFQHNLPNYFRCFSFTFVLDYGGNIQCRHKINHLLKHRTQTHISQPNLQGCSQRHHLIQTISTNKQNHTARIGRIIHE